MATQDTTRTRLITGALALVGAAAMAVAIDDPEADLAPLVRASSVAALLAAGVGVLGAVPAMGVVTAGLLGAGYLIGLAGSGTALDPRLVPLAIALLVVAELVAWSAEERTSRPPGVPAAVRSQRLAQVAAIGGAAGLGVAGVVATPAPNDLAVAAAGVAGLALTAGVIAALTRPRAGHLPPSRELD